MFRMILLNLDKKLSIISVIFMVISIFIIYVISIYNASFDLSEFEFLNSYDLVVNNFLEESFNLPMLLWDERLSSSAVENFLIKEVDLSRKKRAKVLDASAASYILQGVLDALKYA